ncbi:hypothetical protein HPB48_020011 [Haemaphysalis longicornis]|uniref:Uncharacterized protein n=1 Tax=Haemaphysalis longicornis TaxID=44386 RepID=A0A9J6H292_HAELO|nr:hypothetical protein HPB48_020011 [Haemaphysalis longicornis]
MKTCVKNGFALYRGKTSYQQRTRGAREAPEAKRLHLESSALQKALQQSADTFQQEVEEDRIQSLKDLEDYVICNLSAFWHAIEANERLILLHIVDEDAPSIKYSFTIKPDLSIVFHYLKAPTHKLGRNISIPDVASAKREVMEVLEAIEKWDRDLIWTATTSKKDTVEIVRALFAKLCKKQEEDDVHTVMFSIEQLNLLSEKKTPCKGKRLRDELQSPVSALDDPQADFLYNLLDWLDEWKNRTAQYDSGKLTKETLAALHQTTHGLVEIARYCLTELNMLYVLFGKIQTDSLEDRFGK